MVPRENKHLNEMSSKATDSTLSKIDPFDYNVINPFIHTNVKKSVLRSLVIIRTFKNFITCKTFYKKKYFCLAASAWKFNTSFGTTSFGSRRT